MCGLEMVALIKRQEAEVEMFRYSMDKVRILVCQRDKVGLDMHRER